LAIQIFSIKMTGVGAVQSGLSGQDDTSAGAHNAVTQLTMVFAIPKREGDGQFSFSHPVVGCYSRKEANRLNSLQVRFSFDKRSKL